MSVALLRAVFLFLPLTLATVGWLVVQPDQRRRAGVVVGLAWNLVVLLAWSPIALQRGWWSWDAAGGVLLGMPADAWLGWAVAWGALPALVVTRPTSGQVIGALATAFWLDLVLLPFGSPLLALGPDWLKGDVLQLATALVPGLPLAEAARNQRWRGWSALGQCVGWWLTVLWVVPAVTIEVTGGSWPASFGSWGMQAGLQGLGLLVAVFAAAAQAFVEDGDGTPIPLDPPRRLVTTGPYAYVANPMQLTSALAFLGWGALVGSPWVAAGALVVVAYSEGFAHWHERSVLTGALPGWSEWRSAVRAWVPRWRPAVLRPTTLWYAESCDLCSDLARRIAQLEPVGLTLRAAEQHPAPIPHRLTWEAEGGLAEQGWPALCRALEQVNLAWAALGWCGRLPGVRQLGQLVTDALGGGRRTLVGGSR